MNHWAYLRRGLCSFFTACIISMLLSSFILLYAPFNFVIFVSNEKAYNSRDKTQINYQMQTIQCAAAIPSWQTLSSQQTRRCTCALQAEPRPDKRLLLRQSMNNNAYMCCCLIVSPFCFCCVQFQRMTSVSRRRLLPERLQLQHQLKSTQFIFVMLHYGLVTCGSNLQSHVQ